MPGLASMYSTQVDLEPVAEVGPFLVVAGHLLAPERLPCLSQPPSRSSQRLALIVLLAEEIEQFVGRC